MTKQLRKELTKNRKQRTTATQKHLHLHPYAFRLMHQRPLRRRRSKLFRQAKTTAMKRMI